MWIKCNSKSPENQGVNVEKWAQKNVKNESKKSEKMWKKRSKSVKKTILLGKKNLKILGKILRKHK